MKNINLLPVTALVITAALASSFVSADDKMGQALSFPALIAELDSDANGMLSQDEVAVSSNTFLQAEFSNIDTNQDQQIDNAEFNAFLLN